jgi:hypothetical protein
MNKNALILAVVFLVASLIVPAYIIIAEANSTLFELVQQIPNLSGHQTATQDFLNAQAQRQAEALAIVIVIRLC